MFGQLYFDDAFARKRSNRREVRARVVAVTEKRLFEILRILNEHTPREVIAVPDEVLGDGRRIAACDAVATQPAFLEMRRRDLERLSEPLARRETHRRVLGVLRRMRTPVHPDGPVRLPCKVLYMHRNHFLSFQIELVPHPNVRET